MAEQQSNWNLETDTCLQGKRKLSAGVPGADPAGAPGAGEKDACASLYRLTEGQVRARGSGGSQG